MPTRKLWIVAWKDKCVLWRPMDWIFPLPTIVLTPLAILVYFSILSRRILLRTKPKSHELCAPVGTFYWWFYQKRRDLFSTYHPKAVPNIVLNRTTPLFTSLILRRYANYL